MHITVRYLGFIVHSSELDSDKSYKIGRALDNDIVLDVSMISRYQGKFFCESGTWYFSDYRNGNYDGKLPVELLKPIALRDQLEILISTGKIEEVTKGTSIDKINAVLSSTHRRVNRLVSTAVALVFTCSLAGYGGYQYYESQKPMDAKSLLPHVRSKIVEFELPEKAKIVDDLKKYAQIEDKDLSDALGFCTGFLVQKNVILTANHCIQGSGMGEPSYQNILRTHDKKTFAIKRVLGFDSKKDFAFLEVEGMESYGYLEFADSYSLGDKVFTVGNAHGQGIAIREGILANETPDRNDPTIKFLRYSAAASPGNSGGPLVSAYGKIVSLVFAKVNAGENYNLGTTTSDLKDGFKKFVENRDAKKVLVKADELLVFSPQTLMYQLSLPAQESWYENPEYIEPLKTFSYELSVPADPESFFKESVLEANKALRGVFDNIMVAMQKNKEPVSSWESWADTGAKILVPSQFDAGYRKFKFKNDFTQMLDSSGFIAPPSSWNRPMIEEGFKKGEYNFRGQEVVGEIVSMSEEKKFKLKSNMDSGDLYFSAGDPKVKKDLANYVYQPAFESTKYYKTDIVNWDEKREFPPALLLESITGEKGVIASSSSVYIRPNAYRNFTVKEFDEKVENEIIKDQLGREWRVQKLAVLGMSIESFCMPMIQGSACYVKALQENFPELMRASRKNFVDYSLSKLMQRPEFASLEATMDYLNSSHLKSNPLLEDFTVSKDGKGNLEVGLKTIGVKFSVAKNEMPTSLRLNSAYLVNEKKWVATGFETLRPKGKTAEICGVGAEMMDTHSNSVLASEDSRQESYKKYKMKVNVQYNSKEFKSKNIKEPFRAYGYCWDVAEVEEDKENDLKLARLGELKAKKVDFEVYQDENLAH